MSAARERTRSVTSCLLPQNVICPVCTLRVMEFFGIQMAVFMAVIELPCQTFLAEWDPHLFA